MTDFQLIDNVRISIRVELDQRSISFPELLTLEQGSILELRRPTGENVDVYIGKVLLGNGEILVIDSNLAVRVADLRQKYGITAREDAASPKGFLA